MTPLNVMIQGKLQQMDMQTYLLGVVRAEMPVTFHESHGRKKTKKISSRDIKICFPIGASSPSPTGYALLVQKMNDKTKNQCYTIHAAAGPGAEDQASRSQQGEGFLPHRGKAVDIGAFAAGDFPGEEKWTAGGALQAARAAEAPGLIQEETALAPGKREERNTYLRPPLPPPLAGLSTPGAGCRRRRGSSFPQPAGGGIFAPSGQSSCLCLAALADSIGNWGQALAFAGSAMILTVFLALRRDEPLPETEPEETNDDEPRALVFNTALLSPKSTRTTQGVQVMTLKPKYHLERAIPLEESSITNLARYRCRSIPAAGALMREEDGEQMRLL